MTDYWCYKSLVRSLEEIITWMESFINRSKVRLKIVLLNIVLDPVLLLKRLKDWSKTQSNLLVIAQISFSLRRFLGEFSNCLPVKHLVFCNIASQWIHQDTHHCLNFKMQFSCFKICKVAYIFLNDYAYLIFPPWKAVIKINQWGSFQSKVSLNL